MKRLVAILVTATTVVVAAGCAGGGGTSGAAPAAAPSSGPASGLARQAPPTTAPPVTPPEPTSCASGRQTQIQLNDGDNGAVVCLAVGGRVEVYLRGSDDDRWATIGVDGNALEPAPNGKRALQLGVTAGFYAGTRPGTAHLRSNRSEQAWRVTVIVG
jgi:hypothetical protein